MTRTPRPVAAWPERFALGEGIRRLNDGIVLVDLLEGKLFRSPGETSPLSLVAQLPVPLGGVAPIEGVPGGWIAAAGTGICTITPDGRVDWLARPEDGAPVPMRMNDATADPHGRFWAGSMGYGGVEDAGSLYRVDPDGTVVRALTGITVPNGPAFSADGTLMYLADSARAVVRRYPADPTTGALGAPEVFAEFPQGSPDGMTVDAAGALWVAVWDGGAVHRYLPDKTLDRVVTLPARRPTCVCLDGTTLYVTSARIGLDAPGPDDGAVFTTTVDVPGVPGVPGVPAAAHRPSEPA
ncbi:SMP-30/gluconolactonase/LRE family protein [Streptomyces sp. NPDC059720]|uniref:SMP-30/gluconolactonase/LRE family protein n=1 Tax=Streptomyces sp. NPDC059720 TaxID=3346924 RepID=UPI003682A40E